MLNLTGRCTGVRTETRHTRSGEAFDSTVIVVQGWGVTYYVDKAREFEGDDPVVDAEVTLEVAPKPYVKRDGTAAVGWIARRVLSAAAAPKRVAAV